MGTTISCTSVKDQITGKFNEIQPETGNHELPFCLNYLKEISPGFTIQSLNFTGNYLDARLSGKDDASLDFDKASQKNLFVRPKMTRHANPDGTITVSIHMKYVPPATNDMEKIAYSKIFWIVKRDGDPWLKIHKMIEDAAEKTGMGLSSIGKINTSKLTEHLSSNCITITAKAPEEKINAFLDEIHQLTPRFYWSYLQLSPDNMPPPRDSALSGTLRFVSVDDDEGADAMLK